METMGKDHYKIAPAWLVSRVLEHPDSVADKNVVNFKLSIF